jgi:hypothetical protein
MTAHDGGETSILKALTVVEDSKDFYFFSHFVNSVIRRNLLIDDTFSKAGKVAAGGKE